jgi:hypothetical protein
VLHELITAQHQQIVLRAREKTAARSLEQSTDLELDQGVSLLLDQIGDILRVSAAGTRMINERAAKQGRDLLRMGFSVSQVVHSYGDVCQAVTELAIEIDTPVATADFRVFSHCLDEAIASALTEYEQQRDAEISRSRAENLGMLVRDLDRPLASALAALRSLKYSSLAPHAGAGALLDRSLLLLQSLIDRAPAETPAEPAQASPA